MAPPIVRIPVLSLDDFPPLPYVAHRIWGLEASALRRRLMRITRLAFLAMLLLSPACGGEEANNDSDVALDQAADECMVDGDCISDNPCLAGVCQEGACTTAPKEGSCDDLNACTINDSCLQGQCQGETKPCDNLMWCDGVETCNPDSGECVPGEVPDEDDGIACTVEQCDEISDKILHTPDDDGCADENPCTVDYCDLAAGCLSVLKEGLSCDDADPCTLNDACDSKGQCAGTQKACGDELFCNGVAACDALTGECQAEETAVALDDGIDCTLDACDEEADSVIHVADHTLCEDGNPCTQDTCSIDAGGCIQVLLTGLCDDGQACTQSDMCLAGECVGTPDHAACSDSDPCTTDVCDPVEGCQNTLTECGTMQCFYLPVCEPPTGATCELALPLNAGAPISAGQVVTFAFELTGFQDLVTPGCMTPEADGPERFFSFTLSEHGFVSISVSGNASTAAVAWVDDLCQELPESCVAAPPGPFLGTTELDPGTYVLMVDAPNAVGELTLTLDTTP